MQGRICLTNLPKNLALLIRERVLRPMKAQNGIIQKALKRVDGGNSPAPEQLSNVRLLFAPEPSFCQYHDRRSLYTQLLLKPLDQAAPVGVTQLPIDDDLINGRLTDKPPGLH